MRRRDFAGWALAAALAVAALSAVAQEEGPILRPKPKPVARPAGPTLLVICDLACNWKLDGKARGHIAAGDSATARIDLGEHIVIAVTEDGLDKVQQMTEVKAAGQKVLNIELQPVRMIRLKAEQEAKDKADQQTRDEAAQEARDKAAQTKAEQEARDKAAQEAKEKAAKEREAREAAAGVWTDPATRLTWTNRDNGSDVYWNQAIAYCTNLRLDGYSDWRLPTIEELESIYDPNAGYHVKGNLHMSGWPWSGTKTADPGEAYLLQFDNGERESTGLRDRYTRRALCVRRSGE